MSSMPSGADTDAARTWSTSYGTVVLAVDCEFVFHACVVGLHEAFVPWTFSSTPGSHDPDLSRKYMRAPTGTVAVSAFLEFLRLGGMSTNKIPQDLLYLHVEKNSLSEISVQ